MAAIKYLIRQHREVEALFRKFEKYELSEADARELFEATERAIVIHAELEEMYVYPLLRERVVGGERMVEHAIREHSKVEDVLKRMEKMRADTARFDNAMRRVIEMVREHIEEEEARKGGLLHMIRDIVSPTEMRRLVAMMKASEKIAPTRAHPMAPDRPPANRILGVPTGVVDRMRDAARDAARRGRREALGTVSRMAR